MNAFLRGYGAFWVLTASFCLGLVVLAGLFLCVGSAVEELSREADYRALYGEEWQQTYERDFGSLADARVRLTFCALGTIALPSSVFWVIRSMRRRGSTPGRRGLFRKRGPKFGSHAERIVYYRKKALLQMYFGLLAIFAGGALVMFDWGIFLDHSNESTLGIFVLVVGYACVMSGCRWWAKAKDWNEAIVFIGVMPIVGLFIPIVRGLLLPLFPFVMVMMLVILIVVLWTLPDKSGVSVRRHRRGSPR